MSHPSFFGFLKDFYQRYFKQAFIKQLKIENSFRVDKRIVITHFSSSFEYQNDAHSDES